jgi:hypothetical protein
VKCFRSAVKTLKSQILVEEFVCDDSEMSALHNIWLNLLVLHKLYSAILIPFALSLHRTCSTNPLQPRAPLVRRARQARVAQTETMYAVLATCHHCRPPRGEELLTASARLGARRP